MPPERIRVAVIDSGVHPAHPHIRSDQLLPGVGFARDGVLVAGTEAAIDRLGHGTAVTAAIQEKAPEALCIPVRVFHDGLRASASALVAALRWSIAARVDLVNLSLGTSNPAHIPAFAEVLAEARTAGVVVIAAREAGDEPCYPGSLAGAIGVALDWDCPRDACVLLEQDRSALHHPGEDRGPVAPRSRLPSCALEGSSNLGPGLRRGGDGGLEDSRLGGAGFAASGYPRPIPGVVPQRNLYGVSFAVANLTGLAARACAEIEAQGPARIAAVRRALAAQAIAKPAMRSTIQKQPIAPTA